MMELDLWVTNISHAIFARTHPQPFGPAHQMNVLWVRDPTLTMVVHTCKHCWEIEMEIARTRVQSLMGGEKARLERHLKRVRGWNHYYAKYNWESIKIDWEAGSKRGRKKERERVREICCPTSLEEHLIHEFKLWSAWVGVRWLLVGIGNDHDFVRES